MKLGKISSAALMTSPLVNTQKRVRPMTHKHSKNKSCEKFIESSQIVRNRRNHNRIQSATTCTTGIDFHKEVLAAMSP
jgi:hypothetical protein